MSKILDPSYIVQVSSVYEEDNRLFSVVGKVNENVESLSQWRKGSNPSSVTRIRVMLGVAKAVRYFHSMGIVLDIIVDSDDIFLDSKFHARFRFLGLTAHYVNVTPHSHLGPYYFSYETNIFFFGCLFYEVMMMDLTTTAMLSPSVLRGQKSAMMSGSSFSAVAPKSQRADRLWTRLYGKWRLGLGYNLP
ncbi:hypothetical protein JOM56_013089 [Amanita muscaria]